jgi:hypothetical protein
MRGLESFSVVRCGRYMEKHDIDEIEMELNFYELIGRLK